MRCWAVAAVGWAALACGPSPVFACQTDASCGRAGLCESSGYCSFPDVDCPSGRRYGALAGGSLANHCVDELDTTGDASATTDVSMSSSEEEASTNVPETTGGIATTSGGSSSSSSSTSSESSSGGSTLVEGLILHLPLDDDFALMSGAIDASGNGLHAACDLCPTSAEGRVGQAARFDANAVLIVDDDPLLRPASAFSLSLWALDADPNSMEIQFLAGKVMTAENNTFQASTRASRVGRADELVWRLTADTATSFLVVSTNPFESEVWHHFVGVWDGAVTRTYLDGVMIGEADASLVGYDVGPFVVGADNNNGGFLYWYRGAIDEVRFYDRVLTEDEITELASM